MAWLEVARTGQASKMERFGYFRGALHLGCLVSSSYATVYITTSTHVVFSGVLWLPYHATISLLLLLLLLFFLLLLLLLSLFLLVVQ